MITTITPSYEYEEHLYYSYTDYQGSLIALTDENGTVVERYAYDPWGARRNPDNWTESDTRTSWIINRGYTGHEHLDQFGIINMNGRVYDPLTAMFFSPDPYVQAPDNWVNYNRYGYAFGNPFKYTDPSGEFIASLFAILTGQWYLLPATLYFDFFTDAGYETQKIFSPVAFHVNGGFGSDVSGWGWEMSVGVPKLSPISYRYHFGETQYGSYYDNSFKGKMKIKGHEWALNGYLFGIPGSITYSKNEYDSGKISQSSNMIRIGGPSVNIKFEDNSIPNVLGISPPKNSIAPGGDDYRSSALEVNLGLFNFGYKIMDGKANGVNPNADADGYFHKYEENVHRAGIAYIGFGSLKLGINSEKYVRAGIQNGYHKEKGYDLWDVRDDIYKDRFFWYWGSTGGASLWY